MARPSQVFGAQQREDQIGGDEDGDGAAQPKIGRHDLEPFADGDIDPRTREKDDGEAHQKKIAQLKLPSAGDRHVLKVALQV